ncbi:MAG TPA: DapH/DapD/GlmU-related protein [Sedimentisphaerales bacterium]|nr:DapH/DapD/GlmU-related protein [Sedimentisphaerales bacterium]
MIAHVGGIVIGGSTKIGKNCDVRQNVTFGGNFNKTDSQGLQQPCVGDNVSFGAGAVVIGPVKIGSNSIIGANSVVTRDVLEGVIVSGIPAVVIKQRWHQNSGRKL